MTDGPNQCLTDATLVDLVEGRASAAVQARIAEHASHCEDCRRLMSSLAREASAATEPAVVGDEPAPARVGRYRIERELGIGGMGIVFAARDPELGRTVAVKLLHDRDPATQERLRREAQVMAQLAHPNVVAIHDVGSVGDRIFIAMEYVAGQTLARWLARPRGVIETLEAFRAAGRGLAAAHAAGIVHRDFKPENVLVGDDGRVRVGDFGLARPVDGGAAAAIVASAAAAAPDDAEPVSPDAPTTPAATTPGALTATGAVAGTPFYLAPERLRGAAADARSDQFSFCVALHGALYRERPFDGSTLEELIASAEAGRIRAPARTRGVPRRVQRAIRRGLAARPEDRFASLTDLLAELAAPARARLWLALGAAAAIAGTLAIVVARGGEPAPCDGAAAWLDGVWDGPRRLAVAAGLIGTGVAYRDATWGEVDRTLDRYARAWTTMHTGACEATRVRGEQSADVLDLRMACLDARLHALGGLVATFAGADAAVAEHAVRAAYDLPAIADCGELAALVSPVRPPGASVTVAVAALRRELAALTARRDAGQYAPTLPPSRALLDRAATLGYRPLEAEVARLVASLERDVEDFAAARAGYERAVLAGEAGRDDRQVAAALIELIATVGRGLGQHAEVPPLRERARAVVERLDHPPVLEAGLREAVGSEALETADFDTADRELHAALAIGERSHGSDGLGIVPTLRSLALVEMARERGAAARPYLDRVLAIQSRTLGDTHPEVGHTLALIASTETMQHRYPSALELYQRAETILGRAYGDDSLAVANVLANVCETLAMADRSQETLPLQRRAVAIANHRLGADHPTTLRYTTGLAIALEDTGHDAEAGAMLEQVLAAQRRRLGAHQDTAQTLETLAALDLDHARYQPALDHAREAETMFTQVLGDGYNPQAELFAIGRAELGLHQFAAAAATLERAHTAAAGTVDPGTLAAIDWLLGRALVDSGRDRARGLRLVTTTWPAIAADERLSSIHAELAAWMAAHGLASTLGQ